MLRGPIEATKRGMSGQWSTYWNGDIYGAEIARGVAMEKANTFDLLQFRLVSRRIFLIFYSSGWSADAFFKFYSSGWSAGTSRSGSNKWSGLNWRLDHLLPGSNWTPTKKPMSR